MDNYDELTDEEFIEELRAQFIQNVNSKLEDVLSVLETLNFENKLNTLKLIKRELHTLKGEAQSVGFLQISEFIHAIEDLLDEWSLKQFSSEDCNKARDLMLSCIYELKTYVDILAMKDYHNSILNNWPNIINPLKSMF